MTYFLFSVWGSCQGGDRNSALEAFKTEDEAYDGIEELMNDHPDATWKLVYGTEVNRG